MSVTGRPRRYLAGSELHEAVEKLLDAVRHRSVKKISRLVTRYANNIGRLDEHDEYGRLFFC